MRWSAFLATLPDPEAMALVNAATLAAVATTRSVRLMARDAPVAEVLTAWQAVATVLLRARRLLAGVPLAEADAAAPPPSEPLPMGPTGWQAWLAADDPLARALLDRLTAAVAETRAAGEGMLADAEVDAIGLHVVGAVAALADARQLIASAS
jgi:hypothetical protein